MSAARPKVLLLGDEKKGEVDRVMRDLLPWLEERADVAGRILVQDRPIDGVEADICLVFGGDGTILSAARRMGHRQIPTLGINLGRLGFLAEVTTGEMQRVVGRALAGELIERRRLMLECRAGTGGLETLVLNDAVVQRVDPTLIQVTAKIAGNTVTTYVGDGLIVATPVGSTAYSLAAGGPILALGVDALVLTPLASHALSVRPLVVPARDSLELVVEGSTPACLVLDGQVSIDLEPGTPVELRPSATRFRQLTSERDDYFGILREKFGWAGSPHYPRGAR